MIYDLKPETKLFGLITGCHFISGVTGKYNKTWILNFYLSKKGRNMAIHRARRDYLNCDLLVFEMTGNQLFEMSRAGPTIIPGYKSKDKGYVATKDIYSLREIKHSNGND